MNTKKIKAFGKNLLVNSIKATTGTTHLALRYGIDATEFVEKKSIKRLTGEQEHDIVNARRRATNATRKQHQEMANNVFSKLKEAKTSARSRTMNIVHDLTTFNKVSDAV